MSSVIDRRSYYCPFCKEWAFGYDYVTQGRGKLKRMQYFHRDCFKKAVKDGTYWNFKE